MSISGDVQTRAAGLVVVRIQRLLLQTGHHCKVKLSPVEVAFQATMNYPMSLDVYALSPVAYLAHRGSFHRIARSKFVTIRFWAGYNIIWKTDILKHEQGQL